MAEGSRVTSIDALRLARLALLEFKTDSEAALLEAESAIQRALLWLRHDQLAHWQRELRHRTELLTRAKSDLFRTQVAQADMAARASVDQKKAVERAKRRVEEAEKKLELVKRWSRVLDRELVLYRGECHELGDALEADVPRGVARLDRMVEGLEGYLALAAPTGPGADDQVGTVNGPGADGGSVLGSKAPQDAVAGGPGQGAKPDEPERGILDAAGGDEAPGGALGQGESGLGRPDGP